MKFNEFFLSRKEVPIIESKHSIFLLTPIPQIIHEKAWDYDVSLECAKEAINYSMDASLEKAIRHETAKRKNYDLAINASFKENNNLIDAIQHSLVSLKIIKKAGDDPLSKWADWKYVCSRAFEIEHDFNPKEFTQLKKSLVYRLKNELEDKKNQLFSGVVNPYYKNNILFFNFVENGITGYIDRADISFMNFNMPEKKFEKMWHGKHSHFAYFHHNLDDFYQALLFRELEINYLNNLLKNL
ncbi:MAG: hypothetical protein PHT91_02515 [Candidatus Nanoarchaeia archaeon]|nr:hypothetical protein [Candidatus Nanoarchaeia archaeon]MDD5499724.1 hypothetical protein [Candidatus Nanoarchaeia archaeon]